MEEQAKTNPQQQASMRQINDYTVYGDQTDRLKQFPKADPPPPPVKCEFCGKTLYAYGFTLGATIHWMKSPEPAAARKRSRKRNAKKKRGKPKNVASRKKNATVRSKNA